jgi:hypothetical protein
MQFIDSSYFVGELNILNAWSEASVSQAIAQYEKEILLQLLGYKLYSLLIADCTGTGGAPVTQIYIDLVNGAEFTHIYQGEEILLKWEGLKNSSKTSLIAYYVYYKQLERDVTRLYGTGVSISSSGNGWERVSPVNKLCAVWERMRELYGTIPPEYKKLYNRPVKGSELPGVFNMEPSAYNFLYANKEDYPDWYFTPQWNINQFGI